VILYLDTLQEYRSCLTPEAYQALRKYLKLRIKREPKDPLFTKKNNADRLSQNSARDLIRSIRKQANLEVNKGRTSTRGKSQNHAFRKRFEICLANADLQSKFIEYMMGHYEKQDRYYFKGVSNEDIWKQFKKAISLLMLDKEELLKLENETQGHELEKYQSEYKEKIESLEEQIVSKTQKGAWKTWILFNHLYRDMPRSKQVYHLDDDTIEEYNEACIELGLEGTRFPTFNASEKLLRERTREKDLRACIKRNIERRDSKEKIKDSIKLYETKYKKKWKKEV